jgi:ankyrin repeat protein
MARDAYGFTPLSLSAHEGKMHVLEALLASGAYRHRGTELSRALIDAAAAGHARAVTPLLGAGAEVNAANCTGWTALVWAARGGHGPVVEALLAGGANVNAVDSSGETALTRARGGGVV